METRIGLTLIKKMPLSRAVLALLLVYIMTASGPASAQVKQEWVARYTGGIAKALAVDAAGNVYVTGDNVQFGGQGDIATIKYDADGNEMWVAQYNGGPGNIGDGAKALAVDAAGNAYVMVGYNTTYGFYVTIKYDANGNEMWAVRFDDPALPNDIAIAFAVDAAGNVYVTGYSYLGYGPDYLGGTPPGYVTIKYDTNGNELWLARYNDPSNLADYVKTLLVDAAGNVYVTGEIHASGPATALDYATVKYDANGNEQWVALYNGPSNLADVVKALAVDAAGNVYVTGYSEGFGTQGDIATIKYDANGNELWVARYNGPGNSNDDANSLAVDDLGNVYVLGSGSSNYLIKYDTDGNELWVAYNDVIPDTIVVDAAGNVCTMDVYNMTKYDANGNELWSTIYDAGFSATALALDAAGSVYMTGYSLGSGAEPDYSTVKLELNISNNGGGSDGGNSGGDIGGNGGNNGGCFIATISK